MENQSQISDEYHRYLGLFWQWLWLILLATVIFGCTAFFISRSMPPIYQASTIVLINEAQNNQAADYNAILTSERQAKLYAKMMTTRPVLDAVIKQLNLNTRVEKLQKVVIAQPIQDTQLIQIEVEDANPNQAALIANTLVAEFVEQTQAEQISRLEVSKQNYEAQLARLDRQIQETYSNLNKLGEGSEHQAERDRLDAALTQYRQIHTSLLQSYEQVRMTEVLSSSTVAQKEPAVPPILPVRPRVLLNTILATISGLILALIIIILHEMLDDTLRDPDDIARYLGLPILGLVARHRNNGKPATIHQPRSPVAETFRMLRTNLQFSRPEHPLKTFLVTSPSPEVNQTNVAVNLAVVFAQSGNRVILLDADLRRPKIHKLFGLPNRDGLSNLFLQLRQSKDAGLDIDPWLKNTEIPGLKVITSGSLPSNPAELLGSKYMQSILSTLDGEADTIVIDSPPVLAVTDASVLAPRVDGVILVIKPGVTKLDACKQSVEQLRRVGANVLGVVVNDVNLRHSYAFYYRYKNSFYPYGSHVEDASLLRGAKKPQVEEKVQVQKGFPSSS